MSFSSRSMHGSNEVVFDLLHDYPRRLEWDTLLREARFTHGHTVAATGATTLCVGRPMFGLIGIETVYVVFSRGTLAAVTNDSPPPQPPATSAASPNAGKPTPHGINRAGRMFHAFKSALPNFTLPRPSPFR